MSARTMLAALVLVSLLALGGCTANTGSGGSTTPPPQSTPDTNTLSPRLGMMPGLYDQADGGAVAVGTLEYVDLEGGFWAITQGALAEGNTEGIVAVVSNGEELAATLEPLKGKQVRAEGTRFEGVSVRMAGPEVVVTSIAEAD